MASDTFVFVKINSSQNNDHSLPILLFDAIQHDHQQPCKREQLSTRHERIDLSQITLVQIHVLVATVAYSQPYRSGYQRRQNFSRKVFFSFSLCVAWHDQQYPCCLDRILFLRRSSGVDRVHRLMKIARRSDAILVPQVWLFTGLGKVQGPNNSRSIEASENQPFRIS